MTTALRHGEFRKFAALYTGNVLTEWFGTIAVMAVVYSATGSALVAAAMLFCNQVLPGLIVPFLGGTIERRPLRHAIAASFVAQTLSFSALAALGYGASLFVLAVTIGVASTVVRTAIRAGIARSLPSEELRAGNALLNVISGLAAPIGPALAAFAVAATSPAVALYGAAVAMAALAFGATTVALFHDNGESATADDEDEDVEAPGVKSRAPLAPLLSLVFVITCLFAMDQPFLLDYSTTSLGAGVGGYGAIFAAWGIGLTLGSVVFTRLLHWPMLRVYALATILSGTAFLGMSVSPSIVLTCAICVVGGIGNGMDWVAVVTAVQEAAPRGHEARAMAKLESIATAGPGIGLLLGSLAAGIGGPRFGLFVPGALSLSLIALGAVALHARKTRNRPVLRHTTTLLAPTHGGSA